MPMSMTCTPAQPESNEAAWPQMTAALVEFGPSRSTSMRLVGLPHVTKEMVDRWVAYCRWRGRASKHGSNAFLITRLLRNNIPAPSRGALRRLEKKLASEKAAEPQDQERT